MVRHHAQHHLVAAEQQGAGQGDAFLSGLVVALIQPCALQQLQILQLGPGVSAALQAHVMPHPLDQVAAQVVQADKREDAVFAVAHLFAQIQLTQ
ncbi:hypothetical protein D3C71_1990110 [compost metagenome]